MSLKATRPEPTSKASGARAITETGPPVCGRGEAEALAEADALADADAEALADVEALADAEALAEADALALALMLALGEPPPPSSSISEPVTTWGWPRPAASAAPPSLPVTALPPPSPCCARATEANIITNAAHIASTSGTFFTVPPSVAFPPIAIVGTRQASVKN
jgi:hypothetical protein